MAAVIKVVGVGGGGVNAVNRMIEVGLQDVEFVAINTDAQALTESEADVKIDIGRDLTKGLGAGGDPEKARKAAEESIEEIEETLKGADMVFITAGEGGGTGTGAAPVVGRIARSLDALTVAVVTRPFKFEGKMRSRLAENGIDELREQVDALITIPNQRLIDISERGVTADEAFHRADSVLLAGVQGITDLIRNLGTINADFADVTTVLKNAGSALMGIGHGSGEDRAVQAAEEAISSPLLETSIDGAHGVLVLVQGPSDLGIHEYSEAVSLIEEAAHDEAHFKSAMSLDDSMGDQVRITVVAAGFDTPSRRRDVLGTFSPDNKLPNVTPPSIMPAGGMRNLRPTPVEPAYEPALVPAVSGAMSYAMSNAPITDAHHIVPPAPAYPAPLSEPAIIVSDPGRIFEPVIQKDELDVPDFLRFR